ncbi:DGQHR domain-containing protein [Ruegeria sp. HKCCSA071]|uniref:DGQHR domain-containing protein n=1 Tax=Ruegeria sp. HKCCSA071 TaxID=2794834 RepID=UPI001AEA0B0C|nr:DGQHR domain-containing protein [Ruegeria sp. HKCCSA071]
MTKKSELILPALRGIMGDWVFYSCLMSIEEIGSRVSFADDIHKNQKLSEMIQRQLKKGRSDQISSYLQNQEERFFNSLVVATYGGAPNWSALDDLKSDTRTDFVGRLDEETVSSVGFLSLTGEENLFAIDGQHRLAGIKKAVRTGLEQDPPDDISVIFVAHKKTAKGLQRTRRLFTTLNKTAKPVSKGDIIALDEDDVMAITVRRLIEESDFFGGTRIAFVASNNLPATNKTSLTTIGNLYDILTALFTKFDTELKSKKMDLQFQRPPDEELDKYYELASRYFRLLGKSFPALQEFYDANVTEEVVKKHRGNHGGDACYRPLGLAIFSEIIAKLSKDYELEDAIDLASNLPTKLSEAPYKGLMWDPSGKRIIGSNSVTLREVLLYMLDEAKIKDSTLLERYRSALGQEDAQLPERVI